MKPDESTIKRIQHLVMGGAITTQQGSTMLGVPLRMSWIDELQEPEEVAGMAGSRQVCPECRAVAPVIITCSHANKIWVTPKWRAPKKTNDRAWKRIAEGDILWDHGAIEAKVRRDAERSASAAELMRKKKMTRTAAMREARYSIKTR